MNFVKYDAFVIRLFLRILPTQFYICTYIFLLTCICLVGCSDKVTLPSAEQLIEFENAGPVPPSIDMDRLVRAKISSGPYRVVPNEVLELTMPAILRVVTTDEADGAGRDAVYICRVSETGVITLPIVGEIQVAGKTLAQIESAVVDAYYPEYALTLPSVFARVMEYKTAKVSISGAVQTPGIYSLRNDQMSLVALIMEAGGIIDEGAALIRIIHSENYDDYGSREIFEKEIENTKKEKYEPFNTALVEPSASTLQLRENDVQFSYKQLSKRSTAGVMKITFNNKILFNEQMDVTSEIERLVLLKQLSWKEPRVSIDDVGRKLSALAKEVKSIYRKTEDDSSSISESISSYTNMNNTWDMKDTLHEKEQTTPGTRTFVNKTATWPRAKPKLFRPDYDRHNGINNVLNKNIYSNTDSYTDNSERNININKAINKELLEILDLVSSKNNVDEEKKNELPGHESIILPVKGFNIPFVDVKLQEGDSVIVERLEQPLFSVVGLVSRPGNFPYPPDVEYNLMQALAFAGGLDPSAEPRYATIYRLNPDGTIVSAAFEIVHVGNSSQLTDALNTLIKPGDIISVEHTPRTRTKVFLDSIFRINIGTYFSLNDAWDD